MAQLSHAGCLARRQRLCGLLALQRLDAAVITDVRDVYYFTGTLLPNDLPALLLVDAEAQTRLIGPAEFEATGVDQQLLYEWNYRGTRHPDIPRRLVALLGDQPGELQGKRLGVQSLSLLEPVREVLASAASRELAPLDEPLAAMQRRKDADEIELIRGSIRANMGAYQAVAQAVHPGANELDVLAAGWTGAMRTAGEKVFHDGDYQCGQYNGPARDRQVEAGELYIVDAWTCYRGYWSDMSRTFVVGGPATDVQQSLFAHIRWVQSEVPRLLRPGVDGREVYRSLDEMIRQHPPLADAGLIHHGGHAIGLRVHELPDINLGRGGRLETGNVICIEPGGYFAAARHGVRLENMYLITETGCEDLCPGEVRLIECH